MKDYTTMTSEEIRSRVRDLGNILEITSPSDDMWDVTYGEYLKLNAILDERYREENMEDFKAFYEENIKGKKWEEIDDDTWGFYSDWHKDMYGCRPRSI